MAVSHHRVAGVALRSLRERATGRRAWDRRRRLPPHYVTVFRVEAAPLGGRPVPPGVWPDAVRQPWTASDDGAVRVPVPDGCAAAEPVSIGGDGRAVRRWFRSSVSTAPHLIQRSAALDGGIVCVSKLAFPGGDCGAVVCICSRLQL